MTSDTARNLILVAVSTLLALTSFIGAYEIFKSRQYDRWRKEFEKNGDWYGALTMPSPNPVLMWEYRPNTRSEKWGALIATNSYGFRDLDRPLAKEEGRLRVAFAGDSVTLGIGVDFQKTFVRRFEDISRERQSAARVEALGFAVDGYNALQVMELVRERVLPFRPDMVVYTLCMNDFDLEGASSGKTKYFRKPDNFFLLRLEKLYKQFFEYHDYHYRKNRARVIERILETNEILAQRGVKLFVVLAPIFPDRGFAHYPIAHMHRELTRTFARNDIGVADLLQSPLMQGASPRTYTRDIWHLNERGHELVASQLYETLL